MGLTIKTLASGSKGNAYLIDHGESQLLIELGVTFPKLQQKLNFETSNIAAVLISHSHQDHCKGVGGALLASLDVYMSQTTKDEIGIDHNRIRLYENKKQFRVGSFIVLPFDVQHDVENHGFLIQSDNGEKLLFATDTYYVKYKFVGLTHIMIECNYSEKLINENVDSGTIHEFLRKRINKSHFSLENLLSFFKANDLSQVKEIHLLHLSDNNGDPVMFKEEVQKSTGKMVYIAK